MNSLNQGSQQNRQKSLSLMVKGSRVVDGVHCGMDSWDGLYKSSLEL